jgi:putative pyruvate formate lyase activating enzyme
MALPSAPAGFRPDPKAHLSELWRIHDAALADAHNHGAPGLSLIHLKAEIARRIMRDCVLCERRCGIDRMSGQLGICATGPRTHLYFAGMLAKEEDEISPSFSLFPAGCNFSCEFCFGREENARPNEGELLTSTALDGWLTEPENAGARTISFIGGEPTVHLARILQVLAGLRSSLPAVWNSNFYFSVETARLIDGVMDYYIADCHFGSDDCALHLANAPNHFAVVTRNLLWAADRSRLILRHLILPGHFECCARPIFEWVATHLDAPVHVMCNYVPPAGGAEDDLGRFLTDAEIKEALACARDLGLDLIADASQVSVTPRS